MADRVRRGDVGAGAAALALVVVLLAVVPGERPGGPDGYLAAAPALLAVALGETQRRARPLVGLLLGAAGLATGALLGAGFPLGALLVLGDLLFCAVRHGSARTSRGVTVATAAAITLAGPVSLLVEGPDAAVRTVLALAAFGVPVAWGREVRQHAALAGAERVRAEQAVRLAALDRAAAVHAERARMARDLHDVVAGQLSGIALQSEAVLTLPRADEAALRRVLVTVRRDSVAALAEMRAMIVLLRTGDGGPPAVPAGLDRLDALLDDARARGLRVEVDDRRVGAGPPAAVGLAAHRIVQEALANAAKHAPGSGVRLVLRESVGELLIEVDNALVPGAVPAGGTGTGLIGLAERASAVGGRVEAGPVAGGRWALRAALPAGTA